MKTERPARKVSKPRESRILNQGELHREGARGLRGLKGLRISGGEAGTTQYKERFSAEGVKWRFSVYTPRSTGT